MNEIRHHGIKGQKWGVRRFQNKDGSLTPAGKKRYDTGTHGNFMGQDRDNDIVIRKNSTAYRLQTKSELRGHGQTYISLDKLDHLKYIKVTSMGNSGLLMDATGLDDKYGHSIKMKVSNEMIAPSYQRSIDSFVKSVNKVGVKEVSKQVERNGYKAEDFVKDMKNISVEECRDRAYVNFMGTLMRDSKAKTEFFNDLKRQGYSAVIDEWDTKFGNGFAKSSVIVFEQGGNLKQVTSRKLDEMDAEYASAPEWFDKSDNELAKKLSNKWKNY
jgi:hypothetical protein